MVTNWKSSLGASFRFQDQIRNQKLVDAFDKEQLLLCGSQGHCQAVGLYGFANDPKAWWAYASFFNSSIHFSSGEPIMHG